MADKSVVKIIGEVIEEMCDKYCKYPGEYDPAEHDGVELFDSDICKNCPLMRLE